MTRRVWWHNDDQPYYQLLCDGCGTAFLCYDDSCHDWRLLRAAASFAGWDANRDSPNGQHHCQTCRDSTPAVTPQSHQLDCA